MSKELLEVTFNIPKKLLGVLEAEKYFGWSKEDFYIVAVQRGIGCQMSAMDFNDEKKLIMTVETSSPTFLNPNFFAPISAMT